MENTVPAWGDLWWLDLGTKCCINHFPSVQGFYRMATVLNLLDNYISSALASYNILFKLNRLDDYFYAVVSLWIMFFCFCRRHYNKSPLIWLNNNLFWKNDDGNRENFNSVIRQQTKVSDSDEQVREKVHGIFACSERQTNWQSSFAPSKNSVFSRQQLTSLYCKVATVITNVFIEIASNPHAPALLQR